MSDTDEQQSSQTTEQNASEGDSNKSPEDALPDWARTELKKVRDEAASWRTKLRETQKSLEGTKTAEEYQAAVAELTEKISALETEQLRSEVARKHKLPDELAARLRGSTAEELEADAKSLAKFAIDNEPPRRTGDPRGGLDPAAQDDPDEGLNPAQLAAKYGRRR